MNESPSFSDERSHQDTVCSDSENSYVEREGQPQGPHTQTQPLLAPTRVTIRLLSAAAIAAAYQV